MPCRHRRSGGKAGWRQRSTANAGGAAPVTRHWGGIARSPCTGPALKSPLQWEKNAVFGVLPSVSAPGAGEPEELQAPAMAHCASMRASGQLCSEPNPQSPGHGAGQRPKGKGQTTGAETKLDPLIHASLFKSFWATGQTDMGEQDSPSMCESPQADRSVQSLCSSWKEVQDPALTAGF